MAARAISTLAGTGACLGTGAWALNAWNKRHERAAVRVIKDHKLTVKSDTSDSLNQMIYLKAPYGMVDPQGKRVVPEGADAAFFRKNAYFGLQSAAYHPETQPVVDYLHRCVKENSKEAPFDFLVLPYCASCLHKAAEQWKKYPKS